MGTDSLYLQGSIKVESAAETTQASRGSENIFAHSSERQLVSNKGRKEEEHEVKTSLSSVLFISNIRSPFFRYIGRDEQAWNSKKVKLFYF